MIKKITTIEELAIMVEGGFAEVRNEIKEFRSETNKQFYELREEVIQLGRN